MNRGKIALLLAVVLAAVLLSAQAALADKVITLTFTGDCTIGSEEKHRNKKDSFDTYAEEKGYDYFFQNFTGLFSQDDCTFVNLEGVLSNSSSGENTRKYYRFRGPEKFAGILLKGSVEAAGLANNHSADFGTNGLKRTEQTLDKAGIGWARGEKPYVLEKDGIRIYIYAVDNGLNLRLKKTIERQIAELKATGQANAFVVVYHNGNEYSAKHTTDQRDTGRFYIDAGADLVIMHHPHVVQGIEIRNNRTICYSLGNFVFGGNRDIREETFKGKRKVSSLYTLVVQVEMRFSDSGKYIGQQAVLYPGYISSTAPQNNFQPHRLNTEQAAPVLDAILYDTPELTLPDMETDGDGYVRVVMPFLDAGTDADAAEAADGAPEVPAAKPER